MPAPGVAAPQLRCSSVLPTKAAAGGRPSKADDPEQDRWPFHYSLLSGFYRPALNSSLAESRSPYRRYL